MTAAVHQNEVQTTWGRNAPHVRKAIAFIRRRGDVTAEELVEWDATHGRRLFDWDDPHAAEEWRKQQARCFLNSFRATFEKMRVRAFIHVRQDDDAGIERDSYVTIEAISQHAGMRAQVIGDVSRRMTSLAGELKMWKLDEAEQRALFDRLEAAISGEQLRKSA